MEDEEVEIILSELDDDELVPQMHDDLYDGLKEEIVEGVNILLERGWQPYDFPDSNEGYEAAKANLISPLEVSVDHQKQGKELYGIYCAVCHGDKGDGQGILMTREKYLGVPSYADREINPGSIYHVLMYGKNAMGSHAGQVNATERWQIAQHVMQLRQNLLKK